MTSATLLFSERSQVLSHPEARVLLNGPNKILGGGAEARWTGAGNMLTATAPAGTIGWTGNSKDHGIADAAELVTFALALHDPNDRFEVVVVESTSQVEAHPRATATAPPGFVMEGADA